MNSEIVVSEKRQIALVIAPPGLMRDSLLAYLNTLPQIQVRIVPPGLPAIQALLDQQPGSIVILDADLSLETVLSIVSEVSAVRPRAHWIALVNSLEQQRVMLQAGATYALLKGLPGDWLYHAVIDLVTSKIDQEAPHD